MRAALKLIAATCVLGFIAAACAIGWFLYDSSREMSPGTYVRWLDANPGVYAHVDAIDANQLQWFAYAYDENKFANAFPGATRRPKTANSIGHVPAFKLNDDTFIITWKWVNASAGLAISDSPDFDNRIESLDHCFRVRHLSGNIYVWDLDLEADARRNHR